MKQFKFWFIYDKLRKRCINLHISEHQSIDEQMVPFIETICPNKPHPCGFKFISRSSSNRLIHDFILYAGKNTQMHKQNPNFGTISNAVVSLCNSI